MPRELTHIANIARLALQPTSFESIVSSTGDGIIVTDIQARIAFMNPIAEKLTGWTQKEALKKPLTEIFTIVDEQMRSPMENPAVRALRDGTTFWLTRPTLLLARNGTPLSIDDSAAPVRNKAGATTGAVLVFHDITERRRQEKRLEISEVRYRRLFEAAHDGILILDGKTARVIDVNPFLLDLLGYPIEHFMGKELWEIGFFRDTAVSKAAVAKLQKNGSIRYENIPLESKTGKRIPVECVCNVYHEGDHDVIQCNIRDITKRKHAENEIRKAKIIAEAANKAKSTFLANMSHEIRTPMTAIMGFSDMMIQSNQDEAGRIECVEIIRRNATHLLELINEILDLSKIEEGKMTVENLSFELSPLLADIISLVRPRAAGKGLKFEVKFKSPVPRFIRTDPLRLRQILINLLGNAVKFTHAGTISMALSANCTGDAAEFRIEVTDSGIGMTQEDVNRLFHPFMQADESITRKFGGTGLGLAISRQLAHLLKGEIEVKSQLGIGSTFELRLNNVSIEGSEMLDGLNETMLSGAVKEEHKPETCCTGNILLAEDGRDNQRLLATHLRASGASVVIAENGQIALDLAASASFDLILMDMQMPVMDGYAATTELRRRGFTGPIIALTAYAMAEDRKKCIACGCTNYLSKPIDREVLLKTVSENLPKQTASAKTAPAFAPVATTPASTVLSKNRQPIKSTMAGEPNMNEIIKEFVEGLPAEVRKMTDFLDNNDMTSLRRVVHQLRGAGGGYGFASITEPADKAEKSIEDSGDLTSVTSEVKTLIEVIRHIEGFDSNNEIPNLPT